MFSPKERVPGHRNSLSSFPRRTVMQEICSYLLHHPMQLGLCHALCLRVLLYAVCLIKLPQLALAIGGVVEKILCQFDGVLLGIGLQNSESADQFPGFRKRPVGYYRFSFGFPDACAGDARHASLPGKKPSSLHPFLDQPAHRRHFFLRRWNISFYSFVNAQEFHGALSSAYWI